MKKALFVIKFLLLYSIVYPQVGINTQEPTESLDVNGKVRIRDISNLESTNVASLYVDGTGVVGRSSTNPSSPRTTFVSSSQPTNIVTDFNAGNTIQLPITATHLGLNTLNATLVNNNIRIPSTGTYQLSGSLNILLATGAIDQRVYLAFNIQRSTDGGTTWTAVSGARPIFIMAAAGSFYYITVLPVALVNLNVNDLIRLVIYRTRGNNGVLQGSNITTGNVDAYAQHGTRAYSLSISKF